MSKRWLLCLLITVLLFPALYALSLEDALALERQGDLNAARDAYVSWLEQNSRNPEAADVLLHTLTLSGSPEDSLSRLQRFLPELLTENVHPVYARMAALEEMLGKLAEAATHYEQAAAVGGLQGELWRLKALGIRFSMGQFSEVKPVAWKLSTSGQSRFVRDEALAFFAAGQAKLGDVDEAIQLIVSRVDSVESGEVASPLLWFTLLEIADSAGRTDLMRRASKALQAEFPESAITYLSQSQVLYWESPASFFDSSPYSGHEPLQVGVFRSRDGAASMRFQLENEGFTSWLEQDEGLWRVLVNDSDGSTASRLTAKGYEALIRR